MNAPPKRPDSPLGEDLALNLLPNYWSTKLQDLIYPNSLAELIPWLSKTPEKNRFYANSQLLSPQHIVRDILKDKPFDTDFLVYSPATLHERTPVPANNDSTTQKCSSPEHILGNLLERDPIQSTGTQNKKNQKIPGNDPIKNKPINTLTKPPKPFECVKCLKSFSLERKLWAHVCDPSTIDCDICGDKFPDRLSLQKHQFANECGVCSDCGKEFLEAAAFKAHKLLAHPDGAPFKCLTCNISFDKVFGLTNHIRKMHSETCVNCNVCGQSMADAKSLKEHIANNTCAKCSECGEVFTELSAFTAHKQAAQIQRKTYTCDICQANFSKFVTLIRHTSSVHPKNIQDCTTCGKKLLNAESLARHRELKACGLEKSSVRECVDMCELNISMLLDTALKAKHECPKCELEFITAKGLKCHIRKKHQRKNVYSCKICCKKCVTYHEFRSHVKKHKEKHFKCLDCTKCFTTKRYLENHTNRVHTQ